MDPEIVQCSKMFVNIAVVVHSAEKIENHQLIGIAKSPNSESIGSNPNLIRPGGQLLFGVRAYGEALS